jgi:hypothetical protein
MNKRSIFWNLIQEHGESFFREEGIEAKHPSIIFITFRKGGEPSTFSNLTDEEIQSVCERIAKASPETKQTIVVGGKTN